MVLWVYDFVQDLHGLGSATASAAGATEATAAGTAGTVRCWHVHFHWRSFSSSGRIGRLAPNRQCWVSSFPKGPQACAAGTETAYLRKTFVV